MRGWRAADGQATNEYVALVALVAVALALAAGITSGGVGGHVLAGLRRGLCQVADVRCPRPERPRDELDPCPVASREQDEQVDGTVALVRLGRSGTLTLVRESDGRAVVTLSHGSHAGLEAGVGARLRLGRRTFGGRLAAGVDVVWSAGRSWRFPDVAAARRFIDRYGSKATIGGQLVDRVRSTCSLLCDAVGWRPHAELPEPDEVYSEAGAAGQLTAAFGGAGGSLAAGVGLGNRRARDGSGTWYVRLDAAATAELAVPGLGLAAGADGEAVLGYEEDAARRPLALHVSMAGELSAAAAADVSPVSAARGLGAVVEVDATLDLRERENRAAAAALLEALGHPTAIASIVARARALGAQIAQRAQVDRRTYVVRSSTTGLGAGIGVGAKLDGSFERTTTGLLLVGAETRLPGLPFLPRDDCRPRR